MFIDWAQVTELTQRLIGLRPQQPADDVFLRRLYAANRWDELMPTGWPDAQKIAFLEQQADFQQRHYAVAYGEADFLIVELAAAAIGRLCVWWGTADIRIVDIALMPEVRNRSIGSALIGRVLEEAGASGRSVSIHVEANNPAQNLYKRLGFVVTEVKGPYRLMEWRRGPRTLD